MDQNLAKIRHDRSKKDFPGLSLEDGEYVEFAFTRAKIILLLILGGTAFGMIVILLAFLLTLLGQDMLDDMGKHFLFIILFALLAAAFIIGAISLMIYRGNRLYITNRRVIQYVMNSPVSNSVNIIDLTSIEDASYRQEGIMQKIFHYGILRLATVGEETTYTFKYSDISTTDLEAVTKLITKAKESTKKKDED